APDGKTLLHQSGGVVRVLDATTADEIARFQGEADRLPVQGVSPDGRTLAAVVGNRADRGGLGLAPEGHSQGRLRLWDAVTGAERDGPAGQPGTVTIDPDHRTLVVSRTLQHRTVWDARTGQELHTAKDVPDAATAVAWSPDGKVYATAGTPRAGASP